MLSKLVNMIKHIISEIISSSLVKHNAFKWMFICLVLKISTFVTYWGEKTVLLGHIFIHKLSKQICRFAAIYRFTLGIFYLMWLRLQANYVSNVFPKLRLQFTAIALKNIFYQILINFFLVYNKVRDVLWTWNGTWL